MGGAISEVGSDETAYPHRDAEYMITVEANWDEGNDIANIEWARDGDDLFRSLGGYGAYGWFTGVAARDSENVTERAYGDNFERLTKMKAEYDTRNTLNQSVNVTPAND